MCVRFELQRSTKQSECKTAKKEKIVERNEERKARKKDTKPVSKVSALTINSCVRAN